MSESPLEVARRVTNDQHERLDQLAQSLDVLSSQDKFTRHLQLLWRHHACEQRRVLHHEDLAQLVQQRVTELAHDIAVLGETVPTLEPTEPTPLLLPAALGVAYVIEGSRLGAFAIGKRLSKSGIPTHELKSVGGELDAIRARFAVIASRLNALEDAEATVMANEANRCFGDLLAAYTAWANDG